MPAEQLQARERILSIVTQLFERKYGVGSEPNNCSVGSKVETGAAVLTALRTAAGDEILPDNSGSRVNICVCVRANIVFKFSEDGYPPRLRRDRRGIRIW